MAYLPCVSQLLATNQRRQSESVHKQDAGSQMLVRLCISIEVLTENNNCKRLIFWLLLFLHHCDKSETSVIAL